MTSHNSFVIDMESGDTAENQNEAIVDLSNSNSRKSTPKQVMEKVENILNVRKRQHSEEGYIDRKFPTQSSL